MRSGSSSSLARSATFEGLIEPFELSLLLLISHRPAVGECGRLLGVRACGSLKWTVC